MEMKKILESLQECGAMMPQEPVDRGVPVSMNITLNATGKEHVEDLVNMMKNAGLGQAREVGADMMPMRMDMERLRDIVDEPRALPAPEAMEADTDEAYANEPDEQYGEFSDAIPDGDDLHKRKGAYPKASGGDNAMALEGEILRALEADYSAKKARAGKDIGKPGKQFAKIAKDAGERYGSKERGEKVAGAVLAKLRKG